MDAHTTFAYAANKTDRYPLGRPPRPGGEVAADILWSMNSPEYYLLLVEQRGWEFETFERWLSDAWRRLLLEGCD